MTQDCNADILTTARSNVADRHHPSHRRAIMAGEWDGTDDPLTGLLVKAEVERLLKQPVLAEGEEA